MTNREIIKTMFDKQLNREEIKNNIILEKNKTKPSIKWIPVPIVISLVLCLFLFPHDDASSGSDPIKISKNPIQINVNQVHHYASKKINAILEEEKEPESAYNELFSNLYIPNDLNEIHYYRLFKKNMINHKQDKNHLIIHYEYCYKNNNSERSVYIAFSKENKPWRDYHFSSSDNQISYINDTDVMIYQYENTYMAEFVYKDINFDIETNDITLEELGELLQSIVR